MDWGSFLKFILENKLIGLIAAIFTAATVEERAAAIKNLIGAIVDILVGSPPPAVQALSESEVAALEMDVCVAWAAADGIQAEAIFDRLKKLKEIYDAIAPWLRILFPALPTV